MDFHHTIIRKTSWGWQSTFKVRGAFPDMTVVGRVVRWRFRKKGESAIAFERRTDNAAHGSWVDQVNAVWNWEFKSDEVIAGEPLQEYEADVVYEDTSVAPDDEVPLASGRVTFAPHKLGEVS